MAPDPPVTFVHPVVPSADCCHWIVPVFPVNDSAVDEPTHSEVAAAEAVPATDIGSLVIKPEKFEITEPQLPVITQ